MTLKRVEGALEALSSYEGTLETIFVRDARGQLWEGRDLHPGQPIHLRRAIEEDSFTEWRLKMDAPGPVSRERLSTPHRGFPRPLGTRGMKPLALRSGRS